MKSTFKEGEPVRFFSTWGTGVAISDIGKIKKENQDRFLLKQLDDGDLLLAVADGMGGGVSGAMAADMVINGLDLMPPGGGDKFQKLVDTLKGANREMVQKVHHDQSLVGMGTTATCVLVSDRMANWVHVGDSRLYLLQDSTLSLITTDQTLLQFLLDEGEITPEEAPTHYSRNMLDQCVGCRYCTPVAGCFRIRKMDKLLLCSDGLHQAVDHEDLKTVLNSSDGLDTMARDLIQKALANGGRDNITAVIMNISRLN